MGGATPFGRSLSQLQSGSFNSSRRLFPGATFLRGSLPGFTSWPLLQGRLPDAAAFDALLREAGFDFRWGTGRQGRPEAARRPQRAQGRVSGDQGPVLCPEPVEAASGPLRHSGGDWQWQRSPAQAHLGVDCFALACHAPAGKTS